VYHVSHGCREKCILQHSIPPGSLYPMPAVPHDYISCRLYKWLNSHQISSRTVTHCSQIHLPAMVLTAGTTSRRSFSKGVRKNISKNRKKDRHQQISMLVKKEVLEWAKSIAEQTKSEAQVFECPFCGYKSSRHDNIVRHSKAHSKGKLASVYKNLVNDRQHCHPVVAQVMRAIYNHDSMTGAPKGNYLSRAVSLLIKWSSFSTSATSTTTIFTHMGLFDLNMRLVFTDSGPEFWTKTTSG
jgi:5-methylcytosine-specific restriction endonuclease McrA